MLPKIFQVVQPLPGKPAPVVPKLPDLAAELSKIKSLYCAAVNGAQTSLDPRELREWMPNYSYGAHAFGLSNFQSLFDNRDKVLKWIKEYSPIEHVTKDDPPIALFYGGDKDAKVGDSPKDPTHSPILGIKLEGKLKATGVEVILVYPGRPSEKYKSSADYLIDRLMK
jgi:hypothetical protein